MRQRGRQRNCGRGPRRAGFYDAAHAILTVTDDGSGLALFRTAGPHGLAGSEVATVAGTSDPAYNAAGFNVTAVPTATTFSSFDIPYDADATGGTWRLG